jgi:isoquinoline 1-oxidoreductase alpha subunit
MTTLTLHVNGQDMVLPDNSNATLQFALRDDLGLTGTKFGCGAGQCGCCTVLVDGQAVRSCQTQVSSVVGKNITTIEGLGTPDNLHPLQQAWIDAQAPQCGYCQSGQIMEASALLQRNPAPSDADIKQALNGHLCRCGTYNRIVQAVQLAAGRMNGSQA